MEIHPCYNPISYEKPSLKLQVVSYIFKMAFTKLI
jgi:hypothetical protein